MTRVVLHRNFPPVARADARLLLLGSLPGAVSLSEGRYYAHPRNQFWRLVSGVVDEDLTGLLYDDRLLRLQELGIALWDTVAEAERPGSLDADIRLHAASDLSSLIDSLPQLRAIGFNGGTAARIGRAQLPSSPTLALVDLPSSSPAYTLAFEAKLESWLRLRPFLRN